MYKRHAGLIMAMVRYYRGDTAHIRHFIQVHDLASVIGMSEGLDEDTQFVLETAAILHDIGIKKSVEKYGSYTWKTQEEEGPAEAEALMREAGGCTEEQIERVKYLISRHHTYDNIEGMDYQILLEADFLVNLFESSHKEEYKALAPKVFKTATGLRLLKDMFEQK